MHFLHRVRPGHTEMMCLGPREKHLAGGNHFLQLPFTCSYYPPTRGLPESHPLTHEACPQTQGSGAHLPRRDPWPESRTTE